MRILRLASLAAPIALLASCVGAPPAPPPPPEPAPAPPSPAYSGDWRDWPYTPGDWVYRRDARGSIALFGSPNQDAEFTIRCDLQQRRVYLSRKGAAPDNLSMTIRTSSTARPLTVRTTGGTPAYMATPLMPNDPLLDAMGFSRGRFVVEMPPLAPLVVPAWAEILRVTEDCRR